MAQKKPTNCPTLRPTASSGSYKAKGAFSMKVPRGEGVMDSEQSEESLRRRERARELSLDAEEGIDISASVKMIANGIRTESDIQARYYFADTAKSAIKLDRHVEQLLPALASCSGHPDMTLRNSFTLAVAYHAENGGNIYEYLSLIAQRLDDISPNIREAALRAMNSYASQGSTSALNVLDSLRGSKLSLPLLEVKIKCAELLNPKNGTSYIEHILERLRTSNNPSEAHAELEVYVRSDRENAILVLSLLDKQDIPSELVGKLRKACLESM